MTMDKVSFTVMVEWHNSKYPHLIESLNKYLLRQCDGVPVQGYQLTIIEFHQPSDLASNDAGITLCILYEDPKYRMDEFIVKYIYNSLKNRLMGFVDGFLAYYESIDKIHDKYPRSITFSFGDNPFGLTDEVFSLD